MAQGNIVLVALYDRDSLSIRMLHAVLKRAGFPVHTVFYKDYNTLGLDPWTPRDVDCLAGLIKDLRPAIVGLSVRSTYFQLAAQLSARIRRELDCLIVWGGAHATAAPRASLEFADAICLGEGEETLLDLARRVQAGQPIDNIPNLWLKLDGVIAEQEPRPLIADLDALPFTDYLNDNKYYVDQGRVLPMPGLEARRTYWVITGRGCPYGCTYCGNNTLRRLYQGKGQYMRRRSVEHVLKELHWAKATFPNLDHVSFWDDVFPLDPEWMRRFHVRYRDEIGVPFFCYCHPKATDEKMIRMLKEAGVIRMGMGIQSGSERTRRELYQRHEKNSDVITAASTMAKYHIACYHEFIMENPAETGEDRRQTMELILQLPHPYELRMQAMSHFPGTDSTRNLLEQGLISPAEVEGVRQTSGHWSTTLDASRKPEELFWDNLFYMASQRIFPKALVRWLSHREFLRKHPSILTSALRLTSNHAQTIRRGSKLDPLRVRAINRVIAHYAWLMNKTRSLRHAVGLTRSIIPGKFTPKGD